IAAAWSNLAKDLAKSRHRVAKPETSKPVASKQKAAPKTATAKRVAKKTGKKSPKTAGKAPGAVAKSGAASVLDQVFEAVRRSRNGATIAKLKEKTGLESRQLSNALYKLSKRGRIESPSRGVYVKKKG
ncbi:MAG: hypothetical protein JRF23_09345, partial [Deltaproteobacteria bacterium]|nr:hypothetical protein [Deltaproteobacteria bacterium]